jgi:hypothetical protein
VEVLENLDEWAPTLSTEQGSRECELYTSRYRVGGIGAGDLLPDARLKGSLWTLKPLMGFERGIFHQPHLTDLVALGLRSCHGWIGMFHGDREASEVRGYYPDLYTTSPAG